ncbi:MAG: hypothetical protein H6715_05180 [Myxococcales bacterium]|nr:hypothetical protein [Myxococcales bacterium]MCB9709256.1 hypothetical protein [Myxococcales bacterium]
MTHDAATIHQQHRDRFAQEAVRQERTFSRLGWPRFLLFLIASVTLIAWWSNRTTGYVVGATASTVLFFALGIFMLRIRTKLEMSERRRDIHARHLMRIEDQWSGLLSTGIEFVEKDHIYAWDVDLVGNGSLFQRIDTTHTVQGGQRLADWLTAAAPASEVTMRQVAVRELATQLDFRQELECAVLGRSTVRLDARPFLRYLKMPNLTSARGRLLTVAIGTLMLTYGLLALGIVGVISKGAWLVPLILQLAVWFRFQSRASDALDWLTARFDFAEAFGRAFQVICASTFFSSYLLRQQEHIRYAEASLLSLHRLVRAVELRQQGLLHAFLNPLLLWDLVCALRLDHWKEKHGASTPGGFEAVATLEALSALASYAFTEPQAVFPEVMAQGGSWQAEQLGHPLLSARDRVSNNVSLPDPGTLLLITGSNMAGKSTLLRAAGLNTALALAGGPVCASRMQLSICRLRASIRIEDSLQAGASYFHAELARLDRVLDQANLKPPVFFLLDELLRGTNAQARHEASRAVLNHLLAAGALGMIATHDTELTAMATESPEKVVNAHFTDVMVGTEMMFDYTLQPGPVRSSNAVRLVSDLLARHKV